MENGIYIYQRAINLCSDISGNLKGINNAALTVKNKKKA